MVNGSNIIKLSKMDHTDAKCVTKLCEQLGFLGDEAEIGTRFNEIKRIETHEIFVAKETVKDLLVGFVHCYEAPSLLTGKTVEIGAIVVDSLYRRNGIGRILMQKVEQWSKKRKSCYILLATQTSRLGAQKFYQELGYEKEFATYFMRKRLN